MLQVNSDQTNQKTVYLAFGSNQRTQLQSSVQIIQSSYALLLENYVNITITSPFFQTPAFQVENEPDYVNSVVQAQTSLSPQDLLSVLHDIEAQIGRVRKQRWAERMIDIDLLDYDSRILPSAEIYKKWREMPLELQKTSWPDDLILPHPRIEDRGFVMVPLRHIAPDWQHPVTGETIQPMIARIDAADLNEIIEIKE